MKLVTSAAMREMDKRAMDEFHMPGIVLMENASLRVVDAIADRCTPLAGKHVVVVCGKGNNGGDGLAVARHLVGRYGAQVEIWLAFDAATIPGDAAVNLKMAQAAGLPIRQYNASTAGEFESAASRADLIIDALFGTGIRGPITGTAAKMIETMNGGRRGAPMGGTHRKRKSGHPMVVAVDIPSGVDSDTGRVDGPAIQADITVTFGLPKLGLMLFPGASHVGDLVIGDIGMPRAVIEEASASATAMNAIEVALLLPLRENNRDVNKGQFGHVLIIAGSPGMLGAARLGSSAAGRAGAGLVTLAVPDGLLVPAMSAANASVMTRGLSESETGGFAARAIDAALELCQRASSAAIGPGIGGVSAASHKGASNEQTDEVSDTAAFVRAFVEQCPIPLVIDADALNAIAAMPDHGTACVASRSASTVLTPHPAEMGRLLALPTSKIQDDRLGAAREAAERYRCTVLLKGARTLVASPNRVMTVNVTGNAGMSTGGAGDTLTGVIAAFLAAGLSGHDAAVAGAYVHGLAGDMAADKRGMTGVIAEDIVEYLPEAIARCQSEQT